MPTWPRTFRPQESSWPTFPGGLVAPGQTGKAQLRDGLAVGRTWRELYGPMHPRDDATLDFLALINLWWRSGTIFDIDHRALRAIRGTGNGTPVVSGAAQAGSAILSSGWAASQTVLKRGDIIRLPGKTLVYDVTDAVVSNGAGVATIPINPPIYVGASPTDGGAIVTNKVAGSVLFRARIDRVEMPDAGPNLHYMGLTVHFVEQP